jgi:polysaccharide export outer membrane protein
MLKTSRSLLLASLTAFGLLSSPASAAPQGAGDDLRRASVPPNYLLQPGDKLEIQIDSLAETEKIYQIRADGSINHPVAGEISASGKSLKDVEKVLRQRLEYCLKKPSFRLGIYSVAEIEVSAMGEVKTQGKYRVNAGASVLDLLALAGGPSPKADLETATLVRDEKEIPVRLAPGTTKELSKMKLINGDYLVINPGKRISVTGEVREPGAYAVSYKSQDPVEEVLRSAGGTKETAALNRVLLSRPSMRKPVVIDLNVREDGHVKMPVEIEDGDIISVQPCRCVVIGGVDKQGQVVLTGNETLFDIVSASGTSRGKLSEVVVIRAADVESGTDKRETYNLEEAFTEAKSIPKVPIYDGDVVFVPAVDPNSGMGAMNLLNLVWMARSLFAI